MEEERLIKIRSYIPRKIVINSQHSYDNLIKKRHRLLPNFIFQSHDAGIGASEQQKKKLKVCVLKIAKQQKHIGKLNLSQLNIIQTPFLLPTMIYFAKRVTNTTQFSLNDRKMEEFGYKGVTEMWPRYVKRMKELSYFFLELEYVKNFFHPVELPKLERPPKTISSYLRFQNRMDGLKIKFLDSSKESKYLDGYLRFKNYPVSIKELSLCRCSIKNFIPNGSLAGFKNLKALELDFSHDCSFKFTDHFYKFIPQMTDLVKLKLSFPNQAVECKIMKSRFEEMKALKKLQDVRIYSLQGPVDEYEALLDVLKSCPIKVFKIWTRVESDEDIDLIANLLTNLKELEILDLSLNHFKMIRKAETIENLCQTIDELPRLKRLYINCHSSKNEYDKKKIYMKYKPIFNKVFNKNIPLEAFSFCCNNYSISNQEFEELIGRLKPLSSNLIKLEIFLGEIKSNQIDLDGLLSTIQGWSNLCSLKLISLSIASAKCLMSFIESVETLKYLRSLKIGEVKGTVTKPKYVDGVERLLVKRGLQKFSCETSSAFDKSLEKKVKNCPDIELIEIRKKNPWLLFAHCGPILKRMSYSYDSGLW